MAQFTNPIGGYPLQVGLPTGWTHQTGNGIVYEVVTNNETEYSDRAITYRDLVSPTISTYDAPGSLTDCEVLALVKFAGPTVPDSRYGILVLRQQTAVNSGYWLGLSNAGGSLTLDIMRATNSVFTVVSSAAFSWSADTWYWLRFRAQGSTLSAKIWAKGSAEPGSFTTSGTNTTYTSGLVGFKSSYNDTYWSIANFYTASAGETASRGTTLNAIVNFGLQLSLIPRPGIRWADNQAVLAATSNWVARFVNPLTNISAILSATALLNPHEWIPTKFQTPAILNASSSLSAKAFIPNQTKPRTYTGDRYIRRFREDYVEAFNNLLPTGLAWPRQATTTLQKVVAGLAGIWGSTVESLIELLLTKESDPRSTVILLPEWERAWGLPDKCLAEPLTIHDRQLALVNKMTLKGAQSREFFEQVAANIGYTDIHIREWAPFMCGISMCGDTRKLYAIENVLTSKDVPSAPSVSRMWLANGLAQIDTSQVKFGTGSLQLHSATKDFIYATVHDDWELAGDDFTIEGFFFCNRAFNTSFVGLMGQSNAALTSRSFALSRAPSSGAPVANVIQADLFTNNGQYTISGVTTFSDSVNTGWHHFRFVRRNLVIYLMIDGVLEGQVALAANTVVNNVNAPLAIGFYADPAAATVNNTWDGWLDVVQFSVDIARAVSNFPVPIEPPIADRYTRTLLNFDDVDGSQDFIETLPDPDKIPAIPTTPTIIAEESDKHYRWEVGSPEMRFYWSVSVNALRYTWFRASSGQAGVNHHLEFGLATDLECILHRWKPAHTDIIFDYSPMLAMDFSQAFDSSFILMIF
jgi:uncharacterized protein YmfQ (DUF2313 family)